MQVQILGSKFWALGGLYQKSKKKFCRLPHGELMAKKWLDSIEKQIRRSDLMEQRDRHTYIHTDRQTDRGNDKKQ